VIRLFNTVGPRQTGRYGMVLPRFVRRALRGEDLEVYGDGTQRRSFCHVADSVGAIVALLDEPDAVGDVFNIGALNEISIRELAGRIVEETDSTSSIVSVPYDVAYEEGFEDMERRIPDIARISRVTGWTPHLNLERIIGDVIAFERARLDVPEPA